MPLRLKAIDEQNPNTVALMRVPLALFAVGDPGFAKPELLPARAVSQTPEYWQVSAAKQKVVFRRFGAIGDQTSRLYQDIEPAKGA